MDNPRRWQVASVATAAASIGAGVLAFNGPSAEAVAPIDLDVLTAQAHVLPVADPPAASSQDAVIVEADLLGQLPTAPSPVTAMSATTPASVASADEAATATSTAPTTRSTASTTSPAGSTTSPAASVSSPDSPDSVDSVDSIDS